MVENKFVKKKCEYEVLEEVWNLVAERRNRYAQEYKKTGNLIQRRDWAKGGEYIKDEYGNDVMEDEWGYVDIPEDELPEENKAKISVYDAVLKHLEKM